MDTKYIFEEFRDAQRLSQSELGAMLGVGQNAISNYETGLRRPAIDVAWKFKRLAEEKGFSVTFERIYPEALPLSKTRRRLPVEQAA